MFSGQRRLPTKKSSQGPIKSQNSTITAVGTPLPKLVLNVSNEASLTESTIKNVNPPKASDPKIQSKTVKVTTVTRKVQIPVAHRIQVPIRTVDVSRGNNGTSAKNAKQSNGNSKTIVSSSLKRKDLADGNVSETRVAKKKVKSLNSIKGRSSSTHTSSSAVVSSDSSDDDSSGSENLESSSLPFQPKKEKGYLVEREVYALDDGSIEMSHISGEQLVLNDRMAYKEYFSDPSNPDRSTFEWSGSEFPTIELEYPGTSASERIILLAPKNAADEYDPIEDVLTTIRHVLDHFLTPTQALQVFSHIPGSSSFSAFLSAPSKSRSHTPSTPTEPGLVGSRAATPDNNGVNSESKGQALATVPVEPLMRSLEKAKAKRDGPSFLSAIERYNTGLRRMKSEGLIKTNIQIMKGVPEKVWMKIAGQVYERAVGPEVEELRKYEAFSDNVYGELLPKFMSEIFKHTQLGPNSVFVDLGSGVGNCVVQAALATGAESWGFENMAHASTLARRQVAEAETRFRMWGLKGGLMKVVQADFCEDPEVNKILRRADVVLVNNEVFSSSLNNRLSLFFLDLPSKARIVSLKAFASSFTLSLHNRHSPLAILDQGPERLYSKKSVSWKDEGGTYFIGTINRTKLDKFNKREEERQAREKERALEENS